MQQIERKARSEANNLWFAYLSEKNPVKAGKILKQWDQKMQQVHRIVANMLLAQYGYCPVSYQQQQNQRERSPLRTNLYPRLAYA